MAAESADETEIVRTVKQVLQNCIIDDVNLDRLPFFDVDFIFNMVRAKSIAEKIDIELQCQNYVDGKTCGNVFDSEVDLTRAKVVIDSTIPNKITLGKVTIKMKYPSYQDIKLIDEYQSVIEKKIELIARCIEYVAEGDNIKTDKDYTFDELKAFVESMISADFKKLENFVDNLPYFSIDVTSKCTRCGYVHNNEYRDLESFFQ